VRSLRRHGQVVQETVAQLGELDAEGRAKARALARTITGREGQRELFEEPAHEVSVPVQLGRVLRTGGLRPREGRSWPSWSLRRTHAARYSGTNAYGLARAASCVVQRAIWRGSLSMDRGS
jgi:hypothetical protein